jgi:hypothetical protein
MSSLSPDDLRFLTSLARAPKQQVAVAEPPPTEIKERHQLLHIDFWFFFAATMCMLAASSTVIEAFMIERLWLAAITMNMLGISNMLTRDREKINIYKIDATDLMKNLPSRPASIFKLAQLRAGIQPINTNA